MNFVIVVKEQEGSMSGTCADDAPVSDGSTGERMGAAATWMVSMCSAGHRSKTGSVVRLRYAASVGNNLLVLGMGAALSMDNDMCWSNDCSIHHRALPPVSRCKCAAII